MTTDRFYPKAQLVCIPGGTSFYRYDVRDREMRHKVVKSFGTWEAAEAYANEQNGK